jgi:DNA-binding response OmpR family regulator
LRTQPQSVARAASHNGLLAMSSCNSLSVLVLDDDVPFLESFEDLLSQDGHCVYPATSGWAAVEIVRRVPIDLSFLDFDLPDLSGIETLARIRRQRPELPAIFVSGNPSASLERTVLDRGGFALLRKPFDAGQVRGVMREVIYQHRPLRLMFQSLLIQKEFYDGQTQDASVE